MNVFEEFFSRGEMSKAMKSTFIVMISKREKAFHLGDYKSISLVNSLNKIISKVLSIRLRKVMGEIVSSTQNTFIPGRQILDGVLIVNKCVDVRKQSRMKGVVYKLDMEKAYDRFDWGFLFCILKKKGFRGRWVEGWIKEPFFFILLNLRDYFSPQEA